MKSFLLIILSCRVLSYAFPIFPKTEKVTEEMKLTENSSHIPERFCGVDDAGEEKEDDSLVEYVAPNIGAFGFFSGVPKWKISTVSYSIQDYPRNMNRIDVNVAVKRAFALWAGKCNLKFTQVALNGNISIWFYNSSHKTPFNEKVIAYAYGPGGIGLAGDIFMNSDVPWTLNDKKTFARTGINFYVSLAHELGHALGIAHSRFLGSLMYRDYTIFRYKFARHRVTSSLELHADDIAAIQTLYGPPKNHSQNKSQ